MRLSSKTLVAIEANRLLTDAVLRSSGETLSSNVLRSSGREQFFFERYRYPLSVRCFRPPVFAPPKSSSP